MDLIMEDGVDGQCLSSSSYYGGAAGTDDDMNAGAKKPEEKPEEKKEEEEDSSLYIGGSQPATQPLVVPEEGEADQLEKMDTSEEDPRLWGWLLPHSSLASTIQRVDCIQDEISFGRSTSNKVIFTEEMIGKVRFVSISKVHFILRRGDENLVTILDKSSNGTFVNGKLIGKGKERPLNHNDVISITEEVFKPYTFIKKTIESLGEFPKELLKKYHICDGELGRGASGIVRLGIRVSDSKRVAIKIVSKKNTKYLTNHSTVNILNEVKILQALDHPCIIQLIDVYNCSEKLFMILELAEGGELFDKIVANLKLKEDDAKFHFYQIAAAIKYLHSKNIAHRDLKPENILLDSKENSTRPLLKITDMGLSKLVDYSTALKTFCGTPQYLAPEILMSRVRGDGTYSRKVDCWAMGVILYILLCGSPPFAPNRSDGKELVSQIIEGDFKFHPSQWSKISSEAKDLVKKLLTANPNNRLSAEEVLQHPWLGDRDMVQKACEVMWKNKDEKDFQMMSPPPVIECPVESINGRKRSSPTMHKELITKNKKQKLQNIGADYYQ